MSKKTKILFILLFLVSVCFPTANAQDASLTQNQINWIAKLNSLSQKIQNGTTEQKRDALHEIRNLESAEASRLAVPALRDAEEIVRATAAFSVIFLPKDEAFRALIPLLVDKKPLVRRETAYALGKVQNNAAVNPLLQILQKDKDVEVRNAAALALGEIGDASAVSELVKILQKKPNQDKKGDNFLRRAASRSLGQIAQIIQTGFSQVLTPESFLPANYKILTIPQTKDFLKNYTQFSQAVSTLKSVLENPKESDDTRREAAFSLGAIGDVSSIPVLEKYLNAEDYYLAEISRESLRKLQVVAESFR